MSGGDHKELPPKAPRSVTECGCLVRCVAPDPPIWTRSLTVGIVSSAASEGLFSVCPAAQVVAAVSAAHDRYVVQLVIGADPLVRLSVLADSFLYLAAFRKPAGRSVVGGFAEPKRGDGGSDPHTVGVVEWCACSVSSRVPTWSDSVIAIFWS